MDEDISVTTFREYLRIPTVHPDPDYEPPVKFLCNLADQVGLQHKVVRVLPKKPVVIMTLLGKDPSLTSLVLNSHMDVVPVSPEHWKYDPFSAHKEENGDIYARGTQDMKSVGIQYIEAIRRLKQKGEQFLRTIHLTFVPDEEINGIYGMLLFVDTPEFKALNLGLALDEGDANESDFYKIYYAQRVKWHLRVTCTGNPGHCSHFIQNTAAEKMQKIVNKFLAYREEEKHKLKSNPNLAKGDVVTVNLTMVNGGVQMNVVPTEIVLDFDFRVPPTTDYDKLTKQFESWVEEAGGKFEWPEKSLIKTVTATDDSSPWWRAFSGSMKSLGLKYKTEILIGSTDSQYFRNLGYPAFNFSPMINTRHLQHQDNEYLNEKVFLKGVDIYTHMIPALANVPSF